MPLSTLYMQVQYADTPKRILGLGTRPTEIETREAYRSIVLRIHPDKTPEDSLRELSTSLFKKVHAAYEKLLRDSLPETSESIHARNLDFREALKHARKNALSAKRGLDAQKVSIVAKNESFAEKREERAQGQDSLEAERQTKIDKKKAQIVKREVLTLIKNGSPAERWKPAPEPMVDDWDEEEARLGHE